MSRVAIVGAGVMGSTAAAALVARGHRVTVLEAAQPGTGVSEMSFAWVNAHHGKSPAAYRALNRRGVETHHRWWREGRAPWFHPSGALLLAGERGGRPELRDDLAAAARDGEPVEELCGDELRRRFPGLGPGVDHACLHPDQGWVDTRHLVSHQLAAAEGAALRTSTPVTRVRPRGATEQVGVATADGNREEFDAVILTAGNGAAALLEELLPAPVLTAGSIEASVGLTVETEPVSVAPSVVLRTSDVSVRPTARGGVLIADHATAAHHRYDDPDLWSLPPILLARAGEIVPGLEAARISRVRVGERVVSPDGLPVIGEAAPGVHLALMHSGVTLAPLVAELVSAAVEGAAPSELEPYRPDRF